MSPLGRPTGRTRDEQATVDLASGGMTVGPGDALFGQDGTGGTGGTGGGDAGGAGPVDGVGPLPGFTLPVVRLPTIGPDGEITGLDELDTDLDTAPPAFPGPDEPVIDVPAPGAASGTATESDPVITPPTDPMPVRHVAPGVARPTFTRAVTTPGHDARPRVVAEPDILGLSRRSRSRLGSRLFTWFFVVVFALIIIQMVVALLAP